MNTNKLSQIRKQRLSFSPSSVTRSNDDVRPRPGGRYQSLPAPVNHHMTSWSQSFSGVGRRGLRIPRGARQMSHVSTERQILTSGKGVFSFKIKGRKGFVLCNLNVLYLPHLNYLFNYMFLYINKQFHTFIKSFVTQCKESATQITSLDILQFK